MSETKGQSAWDLLERPAYSEVLLAVIAGRNFATKIARHLQKQQPTVTKQLQELECAKVIMRSKRTKAQGYAVNWDELFRLFYEFTGKTLRKFVEEWSKEIGFEELELPKRVSDKLENSGLAAIVPKWFIKGLFKRYSSFYNTEGYWRKGLDEVIITFFVVIHELEDRDWKTLESRGIDRTALSSISRLIFLLG